ncbi:MAG: leucine--tRNA ligase [Chloroflexi bacterium]|nr:leucine--tRNA ligase [Chloroflexota bacterium]MBM3174953.1 leucine--tRNA ligase [Chloroflexota bacterium]MBM4450142.1 leucine--tRNA ligase [Chloroflexota bacterium]
MTASAKYNPQEIEKKWQEKWAADHLYEVKEDDPRPKFYALTMFPYTSGDLHIGHWYAMSPSDVHARFMRMRGYNVLHPMGFDAFGLPAENAAISRGIHPYTWTMDNVENMRRQLRSIGAIYDWNREVVTCLPEYYKWTQWFFLKLYEAGLAYRGEAPVNWCSRCQTVLANEQVVGEGECERCGTPVIRRQLEQWFFRITKYAEELMDHSKIDWPERIQIMQRNWIGKSQGAEISFGLEHPGVDAKEIRVFTTRPDTIYGVTFFVMAPEHPLVPRLTTPERRAEVEKYISQTLRQTEIERTSTEKEKHGVFLGSYVINKLTGEKVPIFIADYVLLSYGTGAVMGVPAHDQRDFEFAKKYGLPIRVVIAPPGWKGEELEAAYIDDGTMVNSAQFDGMPGDKGFEAICDYMESKGYGKRAVTYRIRDWLISRQRYWGAPIPMVYCDKCGIVPVPEKDLPVLLPQDAEFKPTGESPLKYCESFVNATCPKCKAPAKRETDTMDTFMCSSWYFLRYTSPGVDDYPFDKKKLKYWMPVDLYTGGAEHATMHLLYARFFVKAIRDCGIVDFDEPFIKLFNQGTIIYQGDKMSKSKGNVVTPDDYVSTLGADAVRAYIMFVGPWELGGEWNDNGIVGMSRWLNRAWNLVTADYAAKAVDSEAEKELTRLIHQTIRKATIDMDRFRFNTMLAALMEFTNFLGKVQEQGTVSVSLWKEAIAKLLLLLAPTAPHLAEELWAKTGHAYSIHNQPWPKWDEALAKEEEVTLVIQVNGKLRDKLTVPVSITEAEAKELALGRERVRAYVEGKKISKVIYVPQKLVSIVVG